MICLKIMSSFLQISKNFDVLDTVYSPHKHISSKKLNIENIQDFRYDTCL